MPIKILTLEQKKRNVGSAKRWYWRNRDKVLIYQKEYRIREEVKDRTKKYRKKRKYSDWSRDYERRRTRTYRQKVFDIIGRICIICGENRPECLQFDHIEDNGSEHRRIILKEKIHSGSTRYYKILLKDPNIKNIIQTLCANCNWIKRSIREELLWLERRGIPPF